MHVDRHVVLVDHCAGVLSVTRQLCSTVEQVVVPEAADLSELQVERIREYFLADSVF